MLRRSARAASRPLLCNDSVGPVTQREDGKARRVKCNEANGYHYLRRFRILHAALLIIIGRRLCFTAGLFRCSSGASEHPGSELVLQNQRRAPLFRVEQHLAEVRARALTETSAYADNSFSRVCARLTPGVPRNQLSARSAMRRSRSSASRRSSSMCASTPSTSAAVSSNTNCPVSVEAASALPALYSAQISCA